MKEIKKFEHIKSITFEAFFKGIGFINGDGPDNRALKSYGLLHDDGYKNCIYHKRVLEEYTDESGEIKIGFRPKVSNGCIRSEMFKESNEHGTNQTLTLDALGMSILSTKSMIEHGYLFPNQEVAISKKSLINVGDAVAMCKPLPIIKMDIHTQKGNKDATKTSLFYKESLGEYIYKSTGSIETGEASFISTDIIFDRRAVAFGESETNKTIYMQGLEKAFESSGARIGAFYVENSINSDEFAETGILLTQEQVDVLIRDMLKRLTSVAIYKNGGSFVFERLILNLIMSDGHGVASDTIELTKTEDVDKYTFFIEPKYKDADEARVKRNIERNEEIQRQKAEKLKQAKKSK